MAKAFIKWWREVCKTRIANRAVANFMRRNMCKAWRSWEINVAGKRDNVASSCCDGICPQCGRSFEEHEEHQEHQEEVQEIQRELKIGGESGEEGGFVGLEVSESPPRHQVRKIDDLVDKHFVRHDELGYCNPRMSIGDRIVRVDGKEAEHVDLNTLHNMLRGPLHSTVTLSLARSDTGECYTVVALRHGFRAFDPLAKNSIYNSKNSIYNSLRSPTDLYNSQRSASDNREVFRVAADLYGSHRSLRNAQDDTEILRLAADLIGSPSGPAHNVKGPPGDGAIVSATAPTTRVLF